MSDKAPSLLITKQDLAARHDVCADTMRRVIRAAERFFGFTTGRRRLLTSHEVDLVETYLKSQTGNLSELATA